LKVLVAGAGGQLGREFVVRLADGEHVVTAPHEKDFNIGDKDSVRRQVDAAGPDVLINCAAYNLVDAAEKEFETARFVNALGVRNLASEAKRVNIAFVHYGTDYVFDGKKGAPYVEDDKPAPINNYGKSKLEGEILLCKETDNYLILRLSWVFGMGKQNFLYKLRTWAEKNDALKIVSDEISVPTYTETVVDCTMEALQKGMRGLYHLTAGGYCSRFELAKHFLSAMKIKVDVQPIGMDNFEFQARRPGFSAMSNAKFAECIGHPLPHWSEEISRFAARCSEREAIIS
jgi:dTDP-4-dehydrorhamnose reductase